jgi:hypothetical protein
VARIKIAVEQQTIGLTYFITFSSVTIADKQVLDHPVTIKTPRLVESLQPILVLVFQGHFNLKLFKEFLLYSGTYRNSNGSSTSFTYPVNGVYTISFTWGENFGTEITPERPR